MMIKYTFRESPVAILNAKKADAQKIGQALAKVASTDEGRLTPAAVVEAASDVKSPLHKHFQWDDAKAAGAYRLDQAREIIRVIRIEGDEDAEPKRAWLSVRDDIGVSYHSAEDVASSVALQLAVLKQAETDLAAWRKRYRDLQDLCEQVEIVEKKVGQRRRDIEHRA